MIQVTLDLENEHVLADNLKGLLGSLSPEQIQDIASKALFKYLTDTVDYEKEIYLAKAIAESRKNGIPNSRSYYAKSAEDLKDMSDDGIKYTDAFQRKIFKRV